MLTSPLPMLRSPLALRLLRSMAAASARLRGGAAAAPLPAPAAIRVERSRSRDGDARTTQTAVTVWFGTGPALPGAGPQPLRSALRIAGSVLGAAAVAALTAVAAQREASLEAGRVRRLGSGRS